MKVDVLNVPGPPLGHAQELARQADSNGFDGLWFSEGSRNAITGLTAAALATDRLQLGSGIIPALTRSPMVTAQVAWELADLSQGRFILGLGSQIPDHLKRRFSVPSDQLALRLREYVLATRAIFRGFQGERLNFEGDFYSFDLLPPAYDPGPIDHPDVPIYIGAVGRRMASIAGEVADGFIFSPMHSVRYVHDVLRPAIRAGAATSGRPESDVALVFSPMAFIGEPNQIDALRAQARVWIAMFGSHHVHEALFDLHGWLHTSLQLRELHQKGETAAMPRIITDEMVDAFSIVTTWDRVGSVLGQRYAGVADRLTIYTPREHWQDDGDVLEKWSKVASEIRSVPLT